MCQLQKVFYQGPRISFSFASATFRTFYKFKITYSIFKVQSQNVQNPFNFKEQCSKHFPFQLCTSSRMCSLYLNISNVSKFQLCTSSRMCSLYLNISNISKFKLCTSSRMCSLYFNVTHTSTFLLFYTG